MLSDILSEVLDLAQEPAPGGGKIDSWVTSYILNSYKRASTSLHVSELYDLCPRKHFLVNRIDPRLFERSCGTPDDPSKYGWLMDAGSAVHLLLQNTYLKGMGILWGDWSCPVCAPSLLSVRPGPRRDCATKQFTPKANAWYTDEQVVIHDELAANIDPADVFTCPRCGAKLQFGNMLYAEKRVRKFLREGTTDHRFSLSGRVDALVMIDGEIVPLEFKTTQPKSLPWIDKEGRAKAAHITQLNTYLGLLGKSWGLVYYFALPDRREFRVEFDQASFDADIDKASLLLDVMDKPKITARICATAKCDRAKFCPIRDVCFSRLRVAKLLSVDELLDGGELVA